MVAFEALLENSRVGVRVQEGEIDDDCEEEIEVLDANDGFNDPPDSVAASLQSEAGEKVDTQVLAASLSPFSSGIRGKFSDDRWHPTVDVYM